MVGKIALISCLLLGGPAFASADELDELIDYLVQSREAENARVEEEAQKTKLNDARRNARARLSPERFVTQESQKQPLTEKPATGRQ